MSIIKIAYDNSGRSDYARTGFVLGTAGGGYAGYKYGDMAANQIHSQIAEKTQQFANKINEKSWAHNLGRKLRIIPNNVNVGEIGKSLPKNKKVQLAAMVLGGAIGGGFGTGLGHMIRS